jgi:hypothetical protein
VLVARCSRRPGDESETCHRVAGAHSSSGERASAQGTGTKKKQPRPYVFDMAPTSDCAIALEVAVGASRRGRCGALLGKRRRGAVGR